VTLPDGFAGSVQTLTEWEASLDSLDLVSQGQALREWLDQTDQLIKDRLTPLLSPTPEELAAEAAAEEAEAAEAAREAAEAAAEAAEEQPGDEDDEEEEEDEDEEDDEDYEEDHEKPLVEGGRRRAPPSTGES
jgi:DNA-directed RNA polymerase specialized sigma subunit